MIDPLLQYGQLVYGQFGTAFHCLSALTEGEFWCPDYPFYLIFKDDGNSNYDYTQSCDRMANSDTSEEIDLQDLAPDYSDADCILYIPFNGGDDDTAFKDHSSYSRVLTGSDSVRIESDEKKFGPTSGYFYGNARISFSDADEFSFADSDFSMSLWAYFATTPLHDIHFFRQYDSSTRFVNFRWDAGSYFLTMYSVSGVGVFAQIRSASFTPNSDTWYHFAFVRKGTGANDWAIYIDGSDTTFAAPGQPAYVFPDLTSDISIAGSDTFYIDDYYIARSAVWTDEFTVPAHSWGYDQRSVWRFNRRGVSRCGTMGEPSDDMKITVDASGALFYNYGNELSNLTARNLEDGAAKLIWTYNHTDQPAQPTGFKIYQKSGSSWVLSDTEAFANRGRFSWSSTTHTHSDVLEYKVRVYRTVNGIDFESTGKEISIIADAEGPSAATGLSVAYT